MTISRLAWSLYKCAAFLRAFYGAPATERPLGTFCKWKRIPLQFRVFISPRYDLSCWNERKPHFLPSFLQAKRRCRNGIRSAIIGWLTHHGLVQKGQRSHHEPLVILTLPLLRLLIRKAQGRNCWVLLDEYPCARVSVILQVFASFCIGHFSHQQHKL